MDLKYISFKTLLYLFIFLLPAALGGKSVDQNSKGRNLSISINPGCRNLFPKGDCQKWTNLSLIHVKSDSQIDTLHMLFSFIGPPTFLLARTTKATKLRVNWDHLMKGQAGSIKFDGPERFYSFGWSLLKVWMYSDVEDLARLDKVNQSLVNEFDTKEFLWQRDSVNEMVNSTKDIKLNFISRVFNGSSLGNDGYFKISIQVKGDPGNGDLLPFLMTSGNGSHFDLTMHNVMMNYPEENPAKSRFAFGFTYVQEDDNATLDKHQMIVKTYKSLDDEHTPGVFELVNLVTPILNEFESSYVEWKPICYVSEIRDITDSEQAVDYPLAGNQTTATNPELLDSILWSFYGQEIDRLLVESLNISFGSPQDGFYNKTGHFSWSFVSGFGIPPEDSVSLLVILILAIGFGVPLLLIILAGLFLVKKKCCVPKDDLLLGY